MSEAGEKQQIFSDYMYKGSSNVKFRTLGYILDMITEYGYKNIISFGSGSCVMEYLINHLTGVNIVCVEFSKYKTDIAKEMFPSLTIVNGDMKTFDFKGFDKRFDMAFFVFSSAVLSSEEYRTFFKKLQVAGVKRVIDHTGHIKTGGALKKVVTKSVRGDGDRPFYSYDRFLKTKDSFYDTFSNLGIVVEFAVDSVGGHQLQGVMFGLKLQKEVK